MNTNAVFFKIVSACIIFVLALTTGCSNTATTISEQKENETGKSKQPDPMKGERAIIPLIFEKNVGQSDENIEYLLRQQNYVMYFTENSFITAMANPQTGDSSKKATENKPSILKMSLVNAQAKNPDGVLRVKTIINQYIGADEKKWLTNIPGYSQLHYKGIYNGIDMLWKSKDGFPEYQFNVAGNTSEKLIRIKFDSTAPLTIDKNKLKITFPNGTIFHSEPRFFEEGLGGIKSLKGQYILINKNEIGFKVFDRTPGNNLIIDPVVSFTTRRVDVYNRYLLNDELLPRIKHGLDIQANGRSVYISGTAMTGFRDKGSPYDTYDIDSFVLKMNTPGFPTLPIPSGERERPVSIAPAFYITYLGGSKSELNTVISLGNKAEIYVGGSTQSVDFPTPGNTFRNSGSQETDFDKNAFVAKLSGWGELLLGTMIGANSSHIINDIKFSEGSIYVAGVAEGFENGSSDATEDAYRKEVKGRTDGFVSKLDAELARLDYFTYLGSEYEWQDVRGADSIYGLDVYDGRAYLAGTTASGSFKTTDRAAQSAFSYPGSSGENCSRDFEFLCYDGFVTVLNNAGSRIDYSTFYGGEKVDLVLDISVDDLQTVAITGTTGMNFERKIDDIDDPTYYHNIFVAKLTPFRNDTNFDFNKIFNIPIDEKGDGVGNAIHIDEFGSIHASGEVSRGGLAVDVSNSDTFGRTSVLGDSDMFYMYIPPNSQTGEPLYFTYFGSNGADSGQGVTTRLDPRSDFVCSLVVGHLNFDNNHGGVLAPFISSSDLGVYSFCLDPEAGFPNIPICENCEFTLNAIRAGSFDDRIARVRVGEFFDYVIRIFNGSDNQGVADIYDELPEFVILAGAITADNGDCQDGINPISGNITITCPNYRLRPNSNHEIRIPVRLPSLPNDNFNEFSCPPHFVNKASIVVGSFPRQWTRGGITLVDGCPLKVRRGERCFTQNCEEGFVCATQRLEGCIDCDDNEDLTQISICHGEDLENLILVGE